MDWFLKLDLFIRLGVALIIVICANIALGSFNSWFTETFDKKIFKKGVKKGAIVTLIFMAISIAGALVPEIKTTLIGGEPVDLTTGMLYIVMSGFLWYSKEVLTKAVALIGGKIKIEEIVMDKSKEP